MDEKIKRGSKDKNAGWYDKHFAGVRPDARKLLEGYSHIDPKKVDEYVIEMRDKAWDIHPYPCIGQFRFLNLNLRTQPAYKSMVESLKAGARYLDIGCCIGQDIRQLVADGAPHENLYGAELESQFVDLGYEFFQDRDTLKVHFMQANIFDLGEGSALGPLRGTFDFIHLGMVLHMFDWDRQRVALENCIQLLKPEAGALVLGQAVGDAEGTSAGRLVFRHSDVTFKKLWKEIEEKTGLKFDCRAWVDTGLGIDDGNRGWDLTSARRLAFEVERLAERRA